MTLNMKKSMKFKTGMVASLLIAISFFLLSGTFGNPPSRKDTENGKKEPPVATKKTNPPNILLFIVDDLGWNQVGYHANPVGNQEIKTPRIDMHARTGIELDRGYMTPWCGPSRAAIMTGRTNVYNANVSTLISSFDDEIGYVAGLPPGTKTIATAFKRYGELIGTPYKAFYNGKWGIGGTAFANTPLGMGFDEFRGFWGTGIEACDGVIPSQAAIETFVSLPLEKNFGPQLLNALPGYFEQQYDFEDVEWCPYVQSLSDEFLTPEEKTIACKTRPRVPPKHIDLDTLDKVREQILSHDYEEGPILQVFATASLHQPISYPKEYDVRNKDDIPDYFQPGKEKPNPTIDDMRYGVNMAVNFVDDLFGEAVQAFKDAGQWDSTIVYFTTDNGGPIYTGAINNNFPLRGAKFGPFEGGTRVVQFLSGGWLNNTLSPNRTFKSNSYIFPHDIAPTLLDMAGAHVDLLLDGKNGAVFGHSIWESIKNSVTPSSTGPRQLVRKVSYSRDIFFDVQSDKTLKHVYTDDHPIDIPRLWEPIWPKNGDLLMDRNYKSVRPCRPGGKAARCCLFDIENDMQENNPLDTDCNAMKLEADSLYELECPRDESGRHLNQICIEPGGVATGAPPHKFSLWTHIGAAGPFTNSRGQPLDGLPMKCVCESIKDDVEEDSVDVFMLKIFTPTECSKTSYFGWKRATGVSCDGSFSRKPYGATSALFDAYGKEGFNEDALKRVSWFEERQLLPFVLPGIFEIFTSYSTREGFTEWPNTLKYPHNVNNTCSDKGITSIPYPMLSWAPYIYGGDISATTPAENEGGLLSRARSFLGLCDFYTDNNFFCPSHQNRELKPVVKWDYNRSTPRGYFSDGSVWEPWGVIQCALHCTASPEGTAYIGSDSFGLSYDVPQEGENEL